jgi:hypothetical protein
VGQAMTIERHNKRNKKVKINKAQQQERRYSTKRSAGHKQGAKQGKEGRKRKKKRRKTRKKEQAQDCSNATGREKKESERVIIRTSR